MTKLFRCETEKLLNRIARVGEGRGSIGKKTILEDDARNLTGQIGQLFVAFPKLFFSHLQLPFNS